LTISGFEVHQSGVSAANTVQYLSVTFFASLQQKPGVKFFLRAFHPTLFPPGFLFRGVSSLAKKMINLLLLRLALHARKDGAVILIFQHIKFAADMLDFVIYKLDKINYIS